MLSRKEIEDLVGEDMEDMGLEEHFEDEPTYMIVRKYKDETHPDHGKVIKTGLTKEEAKEHCKDPDTKEDGVWFDCFYEE